MKRRQTRGALASIHSKNMTNNSTQNSEDENVPEVGSDVENDPDGIVDQSSDETEDEEQEEDDETTEDSEWISEDDGNFPVYPRIPRFNGPKFAPNSTHSRKLFSLVNAHSFSPLKWFFEYLSEAFWAKIVEFTNSQAEEYSEWETLTLSELWIFLSILFLRALKSPPSYRHLWKTDWKFECPTMAKIGMSVRRFEIIRKYLKFNNGEENADDAYWRVRTIIDELRENCKKVLKLPEKLSLDEMSPAFRGRTKLTISMRNKKSKKHFNIRAITTTNGSLYTFFLRKEELSPVTVGGEDYAQLSPISKSVVHLINQLPENWHHIFVDNYYTNVPLFKYLYSHCKTVISGTWRESKEIPNCLSLSDKELVQSQENQRLIAAIDSTTDNSSLIVTGCGFIGTKGKPVHFLSTGRYDWTLKEGGTKNMSRLDAIHDYNSFMHGNDILDAVLAKYSVYFRSQRWTMRLASWAIDTAVACGFINAKYIGIERTSDCLHADWISKLIDELLEKAGKDIQNGNGSGIVVHLPVHLGDKINRKMCVVCWKNEKKNRKTYYMCNKCQVGLCINKSCFAMYEHKN